MDWNDFIGGVAIGTLGTTLVFTWVNVMSTLECRLESHSPRKTAWEVQWHDSQMELPEYAEGHDYYVLAWEPRDGFDVVAYNEVREFPTIYLWWAALPRRQDSGWRTDRCATDEYPVVLVWDEFCQHARWAQGSSVGSEKPGGWEVWRPFPSNPRELGLT